MLFSISPVTFIFSVNLGHNSNASILKTKKYTYFFFIILSNFLQQIIVKNRHEIVA